MLHQEASLDIAEEDLIHPRRAGAPTPIGPEQYSIWLDATLQPNLPTYNETVTVQYRGDINPSTLEHAFNAFVARHEAWRTSFVVNNGEVEQVITPQLLTALPLLDLTHLPAEDRDAESKRIATAQAIQPIHLAHAPLFRATLVRLAPDDCRLHLVLHHLIFDGFSLRHTFLPELAILYNAVATSTEPKLPALTFQYGDYATWRRQQADSPAMEPHLDYWRKQLGGELPVLRLPTDRPRPAVISHRGNVVRFNIPRNLTEQLRDLARPHGATLYMALLASFKTLLFRYSAQDPAQADVIVGTVADGRRRTELLGMMGYILHIFAVRTSPDAAQPFSTYLKQVMETLLDGFAASQAPFARVIEAVANAGTARRDFSHQPIFQTVFAFQPTAEADDPTWDIGVTEITTGVAKFDLYVEADERPTHTGVRIFYSTDLFDAATIHRMAGHWLTLIEAIVRTPETPIGDLPLLTQPERDQMLVRWNDTAVEIPATTMHGLVESQAARTPNAPAVTFAGRTLTYAELDREANRLAHHLRLAGAAPETLAAVFLDRSGHLVTGLLGILKTGAAYLPLDPGTPAARVALCLEDAVPAVILTQRSRVADLPATTAKVLILEDLLNQPYPTEIPPSHADPNALAYVIHTSGSTGRPKGVELNHLGVVNLLLAMQQAPGFTAADTLVAVTTISFDIAVLELFLPLISGGKVVIASRETALDPTALAILLTTANATVLQATPATWSALLANGWQGHANLKALCGGEALTRSLADRLLTLKAPLELWNVYGPTETTIWSTAVRVEAGTGPIPVGRPIANTTAYILDTRQQPVPVGVPGELYLGGIGLARGYRNKPELTAEKFVPTPVTVNGQRSTDNRLYRTGDHALYRADGTIEVQGRADNQVKIRGYRIELEDVEVNLTAHPQVAFAAAKAWPDADGGHRLCAYLVGVAGPPPNATELRQFLRGRVADSMIPSEIVALTTMPLTANGKVDRKQLPEPTHTAAPILLDSPLRGEELRLAKIWAELLHVDHIAATDNFFDLGGHSLMLLKLIRLINKEFGVQLEMTRLFQAPTLEKLAQAVRELTRPTQATSGEWSSLIPLNPHGTRRPLFLIHSLMLYGRLPAALGDDQPFYALQQLPFEDDADNHDYVDRMLDDHIAQIKRIQPTGPYQLAGWCFAGWLTYEIARRLEAHGDTVSMLALLDSWCPFHGPFPTDSSAPNVPAPPTQRRTFGMRLRSIYFKSIFRLRQFNQLNPGERTGYIQRMFGDLYRWASIPVLRRFKAAAYRLYRTLRLPIPASLRDSNVIVYQWLRDYRVQPYRGDITLIRPADIAVPPDSDPDCGWRGLTTGRIQSIFVPGDRTTMFLLPHLTLLAQALRGLMAEDQFSVPSSQFPVANWQPATANRQPATSPQG